MQQIQNTWRPKTRHYYEPNAGANFRKSVDELRHRLPRIVACDLTRLATDSTDSPFLGNNRIELAA